MRPMFLITLSLAGTVCFAAAEVKQKIWVTHNNHIVDVYVGKQLANGKTEIVIEFEGHRFWSNDQMYSCIIVNKKLMSIKEYNNEYSYVRGYADIPPAGMVEIYTGVLESRAKIDPHKHERLVEAFAASGRKPYTITRNKMKKWWLKNPIQVKRERLAKKAAAQDDEDIATSIRRLLTTNYNYTKSAPKKYFKGLMQEARLCNFRAVHLLAISPYDEDVARLFIRLLRDKDVIDSVKVQAAMGLGNHAPHLTNRAKEDIKALLKQDGLPTTVRISLNRVLANSRQTQNQQ